MKVSEHFDLREFVDPFTYAALGDNSIWLISKTIISLAEFVREYFGKPVLINDWHTGGHYQESGLRRFDTPTGAKYSQHKYGNAIDIKIAGLDPEFIRDEIRSNKTMFMSKGLTTIEKDTPTWVHLDIRNTGKTELFEVPYK